MKLLVMQFLLLNLQVQILSSAHCSQTLSVYVLRLMRQTKLHTHTRRQVRLQSEYS
jgi:hypothetical protein